MRCLCLILVPLFASCTIHLHVHEAPEPKTVETEGHGASNASYKEWGPVWGVVRDSEGKGVEARVALVSTVGTGSNTTTTRADGRFSLPTTGTPDFTLHASTQDGRVAIASSHPGNGDVELVVRPGAVFVIELQGRESARCSIFAEGRRIEDFLLRSGVSEKFVVPPGEQRVRIYDGDTVFQEQHFRAKAGSTEAIRMQPRS